MPKFEYDLSEILESENIAELLTDTDRNAVSQRVKKWYDQDVTDREEWMTAHTEGLNLAAMIKTEKSTPWPGCANMQYPLLATASINFGSTAISSMITNGRLVAVEPVGNAEEQAQGGAPPMGGQPGVQPPPPPLGNAGGNGQPSGVQPQTGQPQPPPFTRSDLADKLEIHLNYQLTKQIPGYLPEMRRMLHTLPAANMVHKKVYWNAELNLPASDLLLPQECVVPKDGRPGEPLRRWTHIREMYRNEIQGRINSGRYLEGDAIKAVLEDEDKELFTVLEQHNWLDLDGDGFEEPYICTIHEDSGELLQILPRFAEAHIEYADEEGEEEKEGDENEEFETVETDEKKGPEKGKKIVGIDAVNHLVTYVMLPALDGSYLGMGFGSLGTALNAGIDTALNQILDAETLAILAGNTGFTAKGTFRKRGDQKVKPGEWKETEMAPEDLQKAFLPWPAKTPDPVVIQTLEFLTQAGERLLSSTEMQTGTAPQPGNQPQTLGLAMMESGGKVYQGILQGVYASFQEEVQLIVRLNSMYLPDREYGKILGGGRMGKADYAGFKEFEITPTADPTAVTKIHKAARADGLMKLMEFVPPNMKFKILAEVCKAMDAYDFADELTKMASQPQQPDPAHDAAVKKLQSEAQKNQAQSQKLLQEAEAIKVEAAELTAKIQAMGVEVQKIIAETKLIEKQTEGEHLDQHIKANTAIDEHKSARIGHHNDELQGHINANTALDEHRAAKRELQPPPIGTGTPAENPLQGAFE